MSEFFEMIKSGMEEAIAEAGSAFEIRAKDGRRFCIKGVADRHARGNGLSDSGMGLEEDSGGSVVFPLISLPNGISAEDLPGCRIKDLRDGKEMRIGEDISVDMVSVEIQIIALDGG
jgi:hypothetical protein